MSKDNVIKTGTYKDVNFEVTEYEGKKGTFTSVQFWTRTFEWNGKILRDAKIGIKDLCDLKIAVDRVLNWLEEGKEKKINIPEVKDTSGKIAFEDDDIPF